jgi:hypothetical protein
MRARDHCPPFRPCSGGLILPTVEFSETVLDPGKIRGRSGRDWDCNEFRHFVGVHAFHGRPQLHQTFARCFYEQQTLLCRFDLPFPPVNGFDGARKYVHTRSESCIDHSARDASRFSRIGTSHQNYKFVRQDFLQARYSFSIPAYRIWLPLACHATILCRRHDHYY